MLLDERNALLTCMKGWNIYSLNRFHHPFPKIFRKKYYFSYISERLATMLLCSISISGSCLKLFLGRFDRLDCADDFHTLCGVHEHSPLVSKDNSSFTL